MNALLKAVKAHALANYENGWDIVIECFTDEELIEHIGDAKSSDKAIENVQEGIGIDAHKERSDEIQSLEW